MGSTRSVLFGVGYVAASVHSQSARIQSLKKLTLVLRSGGSGVAQLGGLGTDAPTKLV